MKKFFSLTQVTHLRRHFNYYNELQKKSSLFVSRFWNIWQSLFRHSIYKIIFWFQPSWLGLENMLTTSLQRDKTPSHNEYSRYGIKPSDGEASVLELWSTPSLSLLSGLLWSGEVVPARVPSMGQMKLFNLL